MTSHQSEEKEGSITVHNILDDRLVTIAARMYHEQQQTQHEIANNLHMSQVTVCRLLKRAAERGIVRTTVSAPVGTFVDLEELLEQKFGLAQVIIARAPNESEESLLGPVGASAGYFLATTLRPKAVIGVASWSASLMSMVEQMQPIWRLSECKVVQILGGVGHPSVEKHADYLVRQLAYLVRGEVYLLPASGLVASTGAAAVLVQDPHVRETMALFDQITVALIDIGSLEPSSSLVASENTISPDELQSLQDKGAVGNICLRFYNAAGGEIKDVIGDRVLGMELHRLKSIPKVVGIACGKRKRQAILGALRGRWINILVTDQFTAESLAQA